MKKNMPNELTVQDILGPNGRIAKRLSSYECRDEQIEMAKAVASALNDGEHLAVEAGTGTGKSFAYLIPAILEATKESSDDRRPIVVSTHTISLQEQLLAKDLPFLNSIIPREFTAVLVKGRRNYISKRRLKNATARSASLFHVSEESEQLSDIDSWAKQTTDGSRSDLPFRPNGTVWDEVASDSSNCMGRSCPTHNECFYYKARRRAKHAQILVVNHALFFSDLALRQVGANLIPDYKAVILDEAHTIESVASDHLGLRLGSGQIEYVLNRLYNDRTNKGLLVNEKLGEAQKLTNLCRDASDYFFGDVLKWIHDQPTNFNGRVSKPEIVVNRLSNEISRLSDEVERFGKSLNNDEAKQDFISAGERLSGLAVEIERWRRQEVPECVYWVEQAERRHGLPRITLAAAPLDVGRVLREQLFQRTKSVILTSATLGTGTAKSFDFFKTRIGLTRSRAVQLDSPFEYERQAKVIVVNGMPDPNQQKSDYERLCAAMIERYVGRTDGRAFALFTSYDSLRRVASRIAAFLRERNMMLFSQADGVPRGELLERFKKNPRSVLLGTDSFWQGVDVPGDALQNVIITKLPFRVPDQPLLQARLEAIRQDGRNPFSDYQLPEAIIKFRQGFGRLIRSRSDRGIVVVLDPRIRSKAYGRAFLDSLPKCTVVDESVTDE